MEKKNKKENEDYIVTETSSGVLVCCMKCVTCRNSCKQVFRVGEFKCCGCKVCKSIK